MDVGLNQLPMVVCPTSSLARGVGSSYFLNILLQSSYFETMGLDDSKVLSEADREKLFEMYNKENAISGWHVVCISPVTISKSMLGETSG